MTAEEFAAVKKYHTTSATDIDCESNRDGGAVVDALSYLKLSQMRSEDVPVEFSNMTSKENSFVDMLRGGPAQQDGLNHQ